VTGGFLEALGAHGFLQNALAAGLLASIACGVVGSYVVVKRIGFLAGGIAHSVLGGLGAAVFFGLDPMAGALAAAVVSALVIGWVSLHWREREDTLIGAVWAVGMAAGILFISRTPGYNVDLMSYLFGDILMAPRRDIWLMLGVDLVLVVLVALLHRQFLAVSFDEEFARLRGVPVTFFYMLMLCLVAVTVVLVIRLVGLILVIALLTLPAAIAGQYVQTLGRMMVGAAAVGMLLTGSGLALAYRPDLPAGATIILLSGAAYLVSSLVGIPLRRRLLRLRAAGRREE
jgi:zinc transport system permease protein